MRAELADSGTPSRRRADIQGLRGLAVVLVVAYHAGLPLSGGYVGVDVFFVISGFVITNLLFGELNDHGTIRLRRFFSRRVRRLLPALGVLLMTVCVASAVVLSPFGPQQTVAETAMAAASLTGNLYIAANTGDYFRDASESNPLLHTWSLSMEEQFYLFFPALLLIAWRISSRAAGTRSARSSLVWILALVGGASLAWSVSVLARSSPGDGSRVLAFYGTPLRAWEFVAGALLVPLVPRLARLSAKTASRIGWVGLLMVLWAAATFSDMTAFPGLFAVLPVTGAALMIAAGTSNGNRNTSFGRVVSATPLHFAGDVSYSWYLWHWPIIVFAVAMIPGVPIVPVVAAALSLAPALWSYHFIENPIRSNERFQGAGAIRVAAACLLVPIGFGSALQAGASSGWGLDASQFFSEQRLARDRCTDTALEFPAAACTWTVPSPKGRILLLGDSHATSLSNGVVEAGNDLGYDVAVWASSQCPFSGLPTVGKPGCAERQAFALRVALETADAVVVSNRSPSYTMAPPVGDSTPTPTWRAISTTEGRVPADTEEALRSWQTGMHRVLGPLHQAGIPVLWVSTVPEYDKSPRAEVSLLRPVPSNHRLSLDELAHRRSDVVAAETTVLQEYALAAAFDPAEVLCTDSCVSTRGRDVLYMDDHHLNRHGSLLVGDALQSELAQLLGRQVTSP